MNRNATLQSGFHSHGGDMRERLELILQVLRSARPIAEKNPVHGRVVERIDEAIRQAENVLRAARCGDQRNH